MNKNVTIIPQRERADRHKTRVAVYARVSTKAERQGDSLENQITHYTETVGNDPRYELVEIYYDFGISGFKEARPGFQRMMDDAETGRFELVITKAIPLCQKHPDGVGIHPAAEGDGHWRLL
ncbi:MAG: recombinase family protein [Blautia sp.]|nr:recombinase family protein [Blautia sp.]